MKKFFKIYITYALFILNSCGANVEAIDAPKAEQSNPIQTNANDEIPSQINLESETLPSADVSETDQKPIPQSELTILIKGIEVFQGQLCVLVFDDPKSFPDGEKAPLHSNCYPVLPDFSALQIDIAFTGKPIAISLFHDLNSDGKLGTLGQLGIPTEPYGFSSNPGITMGAPSFEKVAIEVKQGENEIEIELIRIL